MVLGHSDLLGKKLSTIPKIWNFELLSNHEKTPWYYTKNYEK